MLIDEKEKLSELLAEAAEELDIPDHVYEDATLKYENVAQWLAADDSELHAYSPEIYPQGSFLLGTVVRPLSEKDEYDIDLVCHLDLKKDQTTQKNLKEIVGTRLKKHPNLAKILESLRRCWRLDYPPEKEMPRFHMDVLPAIPNLELPPTGILLTDTELTRWQSSNPKAYAKWFRERMRVILELRKAQIAKTYQVSIEEVPDWQVKTSLQRAVQLLKRHRDTFFQGNLEDRPVSIIITTLAALAYQNQENVYDALVDIVRDMPRFIGKRNGLWWLANPVDAKENFADKWNEYPKRLELFQRWLQRARDDFLGVTKLRTLNEALEALTPSLGQRPLTKAASHFGLTQKSALPSRYEVQVPGIGDAAHCKPPQWPVEGRYKAGIKGSVHYVNKGKKLWSLGDRSLPKNIWLRFQAETNAPPPYTVKWQVVNTGKEAAEAGVGQLRGEFYDSEPPTSAVRWEHTRYRGTHWVEAFVIKNGFCVARSGRKYVKIR